MLNRFVLPAAAALLFGTVAVASGPAAAHWASAPAAATQANAQNVTDVIQVQRRFRRHWGGGHRRWHRGHRGWRGGVWWGAAPFIAAPFAYGYYARPRCGWVWSPRRGRNVWRCW